MKNMPVLFSKDQNWIQCDHGKVIIAAKLLLKICDTDFEIIQI